MIENSVADYEEIVIQCSHCGGKGTQEANLDDTIDMIIKEVAGQPTKEALFRAFNRADRHLDLYIASDVINCKECEGKGFWTIKK